MVEGIFESLTRGNVAEVKIVLVTILAALAIYQLVLMAVGYGKLRPPFLAARPAAMSHRAIGDTIVLLAFLVGLMCVSVYGFDEGGVHSVAGVAVLVALAAKVAVVRRGGPVLGGLLPVFGLTVFVLFMLTWATSAGDFLADR